ncbi:hypothetical protein CN926_01215 [Bacillus thuringiensis]|uniref:hypothetical protein n=1 Tax=Bacillus TaxID=1386 RepID=UPI000BEC9C61|nr:MULTISPECIES: hypothetical protein [Bacillus]PEF28258.1 hypothetical protein CON39_22895 [Bacillus thuringiensis]PEO95339.1 hypothetical protein CN577_31615 [Bacillus toyonensis]PET83873.1 hypothetical protein CN529_29270 [Bacillus thuringiensis]PEU89661.1 hypothetical protein CN409_28450 [Bacillus sp. AFS012607]PEY52869.1 hypothetical protein CN359_20095 [Bacillus thuringiensis]
MNLQDWMLQGRIESKIQITMNLIERYKNSDDPHASLMITAYEHGLQDLMEIYEDLKKKEGIPF